MKLIFDFDYTLFRTALLRKAIEEFYCSQGVLPEVFAATMEASRGDGRDWKPEIQLNLLARRHTLDLAACRAGVDRAIARSSDFFYEDSIPLIRSLVPQHLMFLVTYGEDSFQNAKIKCAAIAHLFKRMIITQDLTKVSALREIIKNNGEDTVFVEDNPFALQEAKKAFPLLTTVRINRGEGRYTNEPNSDGIDCVIKTLAELPIIIEQRDQNLKLKI